jgi:DNA polymerase I
VEILIARSDDDITVAYERLSHAEVIGCDTETSGLSAKYGKILSVQFSDGEFNVLVPVSEKVALGRLADIFLDDRVVKIFHNAKFDLEFLAARGQAVNNVFDTMIAEKVLTRGADQSASLAETLYRYFAVDLEKSHRAKFTKNWNGIWTDELVQYALSDVAHLPTLMREQRNWMVKLGLLAEFETLMSRLAVAPISG